MKGSVRFPLRLSIDRRVTTVVRISSISNQSFISYSVLRVLLTLTVCLTLRTQTPKDLPFLLTQYNKMTHYEDTFILPNKCYSTLLYHKLDDIRRRLYLGDVSNGRQLHKEEFVAALPSVSISI